MAKKIRKNPYTGDNPAFSARYRIRPRCKVHTWRKLNAKGICKQCIREGINANKSN